MIVECLALGTDIRKIILYALQDCFGFSLPISINQPCPDVSIPPAGIARHASGQDVFRNSTGIVRTRISNRYKMFYAQLHRWKQAWWIAAVYTDGMPIVKAVYPFLFGKLQRQRAFRSSAFLLTIPDSIGVSKSVHTNVVPVFFGIVSMMYTPHISHMITVEIAVFTYIFMILRLVLLTINAHTILAWLYKTLSCAGAVKLLSRGLFRSALAATLHACVRSRHRIMSPLYRAASFAKRIMTVFSPSITAKFVNRQFHVAHATTLDQYRGIGRPRTACSLGDALFAFIRQAIQSVFVVEEELIAGWIEGVACYTTPHPFRQFFARHMPLCNRRTPSTCVAMRAEIVQWQIKTANTTTFGRGIHSISPCYLSDVDRQAVRVPAFPVAIGSLPLFIVAQNGRNCYAR